ncbi:hypothetical protein Lfu02_74590 [Longispora fulva]|uniref:Aromatase n=1 Tax=Longispora fulva TaxID=619741 RepID=A0A8J7G741_9ACTN|nr:SRPBCC family protein [Longispora fulva]MBG6134195.1 hypothetical protein [Longispora fulva]GIG63087.1 hypothetical protein Lfu02_74590 [Longispora fulva]
MAINEYSVVAAADAEVAFEQIANAARWPQLLTSVVHAEYTRRGGAHETVSVWELRAGDTVEVWQARRTIDRDALLVAFVTDDVRGEWRCQPLPDGGTRIVVRLETSGPGEEAAADALAWLEGFRLAAERADELATLTLDFEDPLFAGGAVSDAYRVLYEADRWPEKLSHVLRLDMTEAVPNIQFFDMDTKAKDGSTVTTRSVRVCLPQRLIVYKQISPPPLLEVHTGHWRFTPTPEGVILGARHTCTIRPDRLDVLGEGTTLTDARKYLRRFLSANSTTNLRLAKTYAEEQAGR